MILYHFTSLYALKNGGTILQEGLKPTAVPNDGLPNSCVWFTAEPEPVRWWQANNPPEVRIKVVIPDMDYRLVLYEKWKRQHFSEDELRRVDEYALETALANGATGRLAWRKWYLYFGSIPVSRFRAVEYADSAR